jgi:hypothetical protein
MGEFLKVMLKNFGNEKVRQVPSHLPDFFCCRFSTSSDKNIWYDLEKILRLGHVEMEINLEKSEYYRQSYGCEKGNCYQEAAMLLMQGKKRADRQVVGYIIPPDEKIAIRHSWNVKDDQIIDSTLGSEAEIYRYVEIFSIKKWNKKNFESFEDILFDFDSKAEQDFREQYKKMGYDIGIGKIDGIGLIYG